MIKTRILIISDTHCASLRKPPPGQVRKAEPMPPFMYPLPQADLMIHCGDLTGRGRTSEYLEALDMLGDIDAPVKLVIAGNHDYSLDRGFMTAPGKRHGMPSPSAGEEAWSRARDLWVGPDGRAAREGITFLDEGIHQIQLKNGASVLVYASPYTPFFQDWGFAYGHGEDRFNVAGESVEGASNIALCPVPSRGGPRDVDVIITHGPPYGRLDRTSRGVHVGCPHLLTALARCRPQVHCFGHIHEGWGAERVRWDVEETDGHKADLDRRQFKRAVNVENTTAIPAADTVVPIDVDVDEVRKKHGAHLDLSSTGDNPLISGTETLLVNAAIMDVRYRPVNSAWIVEIDLPTT